MLPELTQSVIVHDRYHTDCTNNKAPVTRSLWKGRLILPELCCLTITDLETTVVPQQCTELP